MELKELLERLKSPDPWVRVEALRILAMVEETRALKAIEDVFKNDLEPGVKQIAQWAGRIVWQAQKRQTDKVPAIPATTHTQSRQEIEEELFLARLVADQDSRIVGTAMQAQALQYELNKTLLDAKAKMPLPKPEEPKKADNDPLDLLNAGLSGDLLDK